MVDLDLPAGGRDAVLDHRDRARPVLDAPARIVFGVERIEPEDSRPAGDRRGFADDEGDVGRGFAEPADDTAGEDDQDPEMDDIGAEEAQDAAASPEETASAVAPLPDAVAPRLELGAGTAAAVPSRLPFRTNASLSFKAPMDGGVEAGILAEGPFKLGGEPGQAADGEVSPEKNEQGEISGGLVEPVEAKPRHERGGSPVSGPVFAGGPLLGNEGPQGRRRCEEDEQGEGELYRTQEFEDGSHGPEGSRSPRGSVAPRLLFLLLGHLDQIGQGDVLEIVLQEKRGFLPDVMGGAIGLAFAEVRFLDALDETAGPLEGVEDLPEVDRGKGPWPACNRRPRRGCS